jgi:hypothetical protein
MYENKRKQVRRVKEASFGRFSNFPSMIHGIAKISHKTSSLRLQRVVAEALHDLNGYKTAQILSVASRSGRYSGEITFEVGVADDLYFNYLDDETHTHFLTRLKSRRALQALDVLIIVLYHYYKTGKRIPLNFDHNIIRFTFKKGELNVYLFHVKGIRRMPLDDLLNLVITRIKEKMTKNRLKTFKINYVRTY